MKETAKNYEKRIENGDFKNYLRGRGIDIGGGVDCLVLPPDVKGTVDLWDIKNGDAQYVHQIADNIYDFVYSSHCLEHMRDLDRAFTNWLRICKPGGYLYLCVPHEKYYEKNQWPSKYNCDHKFSFTVSEKTNLPANVVLKEFLSKYEKWIEVIEIRENLMNYHFDWDKNIDQTLRYEDKICAQIDIIVRKKEMELSEKWRKENAGNWFIDYWIIMLPIQMKNYLRICKRFLKKKKGKNHKK